jgi:hypothetical protein
VKTADDVYALLGFVERTPGLLPVAPRAVTREDFLARLQRGHDCLLCGASASSCAIVQTRHGNGWLDFCPSCTDLLERAFPAGGNPRYPVTSDKQGTQRQQDHHAKQTER